MKNGENCFKQRAICETFAHIGWHAVSVNQSFQRTLGHAKMRANIGYSVALNEFLIHIAQEPLNLVH
jgi:hypothetical protein